jgi:hypothetical protein
MTDQQARRPLGQPDPRPTPITERVAAHLRSCASVWRRDPDTPRPRDAASDRASWRSGWLCVCASACLRIRAFALSGRQAVRAVRAASIPLPHRRAVSMGGRS